MTYLVPTKPVLHSSTNIAGAPRAANLSKSLAICCPECPNLCQAATPIARGATSANSYNFRGESTWCAAAQSQPPLEYRVAAPVPAKALPDSQVCSAAEVFAKAESRAMTPLGVHHHSSGQGSTIFQRSSPFLIFFISVVSPPFLRIQDFTVSG